jgi:hypothetical protein
MDNYFEYVEKIILKGRDCNHYEFFVKIPVEDLMNKKRMNDVFEDNLEIYKRIKNIIKDIESKCEKYSTMNFKIIKFKHFTGNYSIYINYSYIEKSYIFSSTFKLCEFDENLYIQLIKKIGSYYEWEDNDEKLTENIGKKQLTLFSILFNNLIKN